MSEGDISPRSYKPKPLTKRQLLEMEKKFAETSMRLDQIKELEEKHQENVGHPEWI